ncbi:MAG: hypothetical protein ACLP4W_03605 [Mycobacterium sp.]|uniref:hypothetical protein n=1 Tax=Mycobacterium sp. TaxID=1785 RepID=UPI003F945899
MLLVGVSVVAALVIAALVALPGKMIGDELRARVDDLPVLFVRLALRLLPEDMRAYYKPDWEGNLLAAFNDETAKYPVTRFVRSFKFGFSLLLGSRQIRKETKVRERPPTQEIHIHIPVEIFNHTTTVINQTSSVVIGPQPAELKIQGHAPEVKIEAAPG